VKISCRKNKLLDPEEVGTTILRNAKTDYATANILEHSNLHLSLRLNELAAVVWACATVTVSELNFATFSKGLYGCIFLS
jgi:hypothetical protein